MACCCKEAAGSKIRLIWRQVRYSPECTWSTTEYISWTVRVTEQMESQASLCGICSMINDDAKCILEITSTTVMAKAAFNNKSTFFTSKLEFNLRKKHLEYSLVWCWKLETWKVDQKYLGRFEMWRWRRMELDRSCEKWRNTVLQTVKDERNILPRRRKIRKEEEEDEEQERLTGLIASCVITALYNTLLKERLGKGQKWWEDEEDVSSYRVALSKREDTVNFNRKN